MLIRGSSGAGKSRLALDLIAAAETGLIRFARLVGDDRVHLVSTAGRLLVRPAEALAGLIEVRGFGLRRLPYESCAVVGWVVDLAAVDAERLPPEAQRLVEIAGITLPRLAVAAGAAALPAVLALVTCSPSASGGEAAGP